MSLNFSAAIGKRGNFVAGTTGIIMLKITNFAGDPQNADSISINIYPKGSPSEVITTGEVVFVRDGFYVYDWEIESTQDIGLYTAEWVYIIDGDTHVDYQDINVSDQEEGSALYTGRLAEFRLALEAYICCAQSIPVYYEEARPSVDNKTFVFNFPRWNQGKNIRIYRNGQIIDSGANIDMFKGRVTFSNSLLTQERVSADYNFRWFSDEQLDRFLLNAVQIVNTYPPHSQYTIYSVEDKWIPAVIYIAATDALRELIMCLQFQEPAEVFGGPDAARQASSTFESLKGNYEKTWTELLKNKVFLPYKGRTKAVVTPTFTLPGGRSRWFRYLFSGGAS